MVIGEVCGDDPVEAARLMVSAMYSAVGGDEWSLVVEQVEGVETTTVSVRGVSLDLQDTSVNLTLAPNYLSCKDPADLRTLHDRITAQLPKRRLTALQAATEALEYVEEMQTVLENVREVSDQLDMLEEIRDTQASLHDLWMALGGIAFVEDPANDKD